MLRLLDARTGQIAEIRPRHRGELRILLSAQAADGPGLARGYLAADLIRRYAERAGLLPAVCDLVPDGLDADRLRADCDALNIHPPLHTRAPGRAAEFAALFPGGSSFDIGITLTDQVPEVTANADHLIVTAEAASPLPQDDDPLALRLVLLGRRYQEPATISPDDLAEGLATLRRWREQVARWAQSPSTRMSPDYSTAIADAVADDLHTDAALRTAADLEADAGLPDGTKFETFAAADRLLGLDLARDIGKL